MKHDPDPMNHIYDIGVFVGSGFGIATEDMYSPVFQDMDLEFN
jgi:hypothetical protein